MVLIQTRHKATYYVNKPNFVWDLFSSTHTHHPYIVLSEFEAPDEVVVLDEAAVDGGEVVARPPVHHPHQVSVLALPGGEVDRDLSQQGSEQKRLLLCTLL